LYTRQAAAWLFQGYGVVAELVRQINKGIRQVNWGKWQIGKQNSQVKTPFWQVRQFSLEKAIEKVSPDRETTTKVKDNDLSQAAAWLFQGYGVVANWLGR
jgi:hypothetical protein